MNKFCISLLLLIFLNSSIFCEEYYFVEINNNQPVIIIENKNILFDFQTHLLNSQLNDNANIKVTTSFAKNIYRIWGTGSRHKIFCDSFKLKYITRFNIGDLVNIQHVNLEGNGTIIKATVDSIFYETMNYYQNNAKSKLLLYCSPNIVQSTDGTNFNGNIYIASNYNEYKPKHSKILIPDIIEYLIDSLSTIILTEEIDEKYSKVTQTSLIADRSIYYIALISYGEKGHTGHLFIFNNSGRILLENTKDYNYIVGKTDVNSDRDQELIIFYGDSYGGGIEVLTIDDRSKENIKLVSNLRYQTVHD